MELLPARQLNVKNSKVYLISRVCSLFAIKIKSKGIQWIGSRECDTIDDI